MLLAVSDFMNSSSDSMTDIFSPEQRSTWAAPINSTKDELATANDAEAEVRDEPRHRPHSMTPCSDRDGSAYSGQGQSQEAAIVLLSDSESDSEDQDQDSDSSIPSISAMIKAIPAKSGRELIPSDMPNTFRTAALTPDKASDLGDASCDTSAGHPPLGATCEEQEETQRASSRNQSLIGSTMESVRTYLPDNDDVTITQQSCEPTAHIAGLNCSPQGFDGKRSLEDDDAVLGEVPPRKSMRRNDVISPDTAVSDSTNDSGEDGSRAADGGSDVDSGDNDDEDNGSDTVSDDADRGDDAGRRYDSDYTPSDTDNVEERPSNTSSDDESDNDCYRPRKRRRHAKDQASDQTSRATVRRAKPMSCSSPYQSPSQQSLRVDAGFAPSPPPSHNMSGLETDDEDSITTPMASFSEWQLHSATLKSVTMNGVTNYQLFFKRACQIRRSMAKAHQSSCAKLKSCDQTRDFDRWSREGQGRRVRFSAEEDDLIIELKEKHRLSWTEIYDRCSTRFGRRSKEALQVRYCTKLKSRR